MKRLTIDYSNVLDFISEDELIDCGRYASFVLESLKNKTGEGNDYVGWVDYPALINYNDIIEIEKTKEKIIKESKCLIVVGIGGSYLGAKAIIDALSKSIIPSRVIPVAEGYAEVVVNDKLLRVRDTGCRPSEDEHPKNDNRERCGDNFNPVVREHLYEPSFCNFCVHSTPLS